MKTKIEKMTLKKFENYQIDNNHFAVINGGTYTNICTTHINGTRAYDTFNDDSKITSGPLTGHWEAKDLTGEVTPSASCPS
jgi:hypothetical protein